MAQGKREIQPRRTALVVVEGETELAFCRYLKAIQSRGKNIQIQIKCAHGGSPDKIVEYARRQMKYSSHDQLVVILDDDRALSEESKVVLQEFNAELICSNPCIEGFFLELLGYTKPSTSEECKKRFHKVGLSEKDKLSHEAYARLFPADKMDDYCRHPDFARLRQLFENKER